MLQPIERACDVNALGRATRVHAVNLGDFDAQGAANEHVAQQIRDGIARFLRDLDPDDAEAFSAAVLAGDCVWTFEGGEHPHRAVVEACGRKVAINLSRN